MHRSPWNKGKLIGSKPPLRTNNVWSIRTKLQVERRIRDLAMFNLAIDSKLRGCDVVSLTVDDVAPNGVAIDRATVRQRKTGHPVRFELSEQTREAVDAYIRAAQRRRVSSCSQADAIPATLSRPDSMPVLYPGGSPGSAWIQHCTALIRFAAPRPHSSIARPATSVPSSCCWATAKSRALFGISASRWTMLWPSPSRWMSELPGQSGLALPSSLGRLRAKSSHKLNYSIASRSSDCCGRNEGTTYLRRRVLPESGL